MHLALEVTYEDIERLTDYQLTDLLRRLLHLEAVSVGIPGSAIAVSLKITVSDGGEDGVIQWVDGPDRTDWLPNRYTLFQCKATDMPPAACRGEILKKGSVQLKPQVEEVLDAGGTYILFYGRSCNSGQVKSRVAKFREAVRDAGKAYASTADILIYDANKIAN